ncbi:BA75_02772T0 [Komagataella pastoris]|uniref:BA75_02772T0 n=1 Tax=Komagataella pastoris TaxID=4922 RepID=A0A1B2JB72_PICPA|nr:BA75_02772T0 [Komagataella pastoris]
MGWNIKRLEDGDLCCTITEFEDKVVIQVTYAGQLDTTFQVLRDDVQVLVGNTMVSDGTDLKNRVIAGEIGKLLALESNKQLILSISSKIWKCMPGSEFDVMTKVLLTVKEAMNEIPQATTTA